MMLTLQQKKIYIFDATNDIGSFAKLNSFSKYNKPPLQNTNIFLISSKIRTERVICCIFKSIK